MSQGYIIFISTRLSSFHIIHDHVGDNTYIILQSVYRINK